MNTEIAEPLVESPLPKPNEMLITEARQLQHYHRRRWVAALVLIAIVAAVLVVAAGGGRRPSPTLAPNSSTSSRSSTAASASTKPAIVRGHVLSYAESNAAGYVGDVAYGTPEIFQSTSVGVPDPTAISCDGAHCFGLGTSAAFQYPAISSDHGQTWRIGGHWFAGAWADSAAFASRMTALNVTNAVAWFPLQNSGFYSTSTAGRTWYAVVWPGLVTSVTGSNGYVITVKLVGFNSPRSGKSFRYSTNDGGSVWKLDK
jgi:hypothetical protein